MIRRINLLPPELSARRRSRRALLGILAGGAALIALLLIVFVAQKARLGNERGKLEEQQRANARLSRQVSRLRRFAQQQEELRQREQLLQALTGSEILWSGVLKDVSVVIPPDDWLVSFTGSATAAGTPGAIGTVQVAGCTLVPADGDHLNVVQFLIQIAKPLSFSDDPFLTLTSKTDSEQCPVQFNAQLQLTESARRSAQAGRERRA